MKIVKNEEEEFNKSLSKLALKAKFCIMTAKDKWGQYQCLHSNDPETKKGHIYNIYQYPALLRVLGRKADLFTSQLQQELYEEEQTIVAILNWKGMKREFIHLKFSQENEAFIVDFLSKNKEVILGYIAKVNREMNAGDLECP